MAEGPRPSDLHGLYRRFRDEPRWYVEVNPPGVFTADLVGCGYACRWCWSTYGLAGKEQAKWLTGEQVGKRLLEGARKNNRAIARISHGEPFIYPEHIISVAETFVGLREATEERMLIIETNGSRAEPKWLNELNAICERKPIIYPRENQAAAPITVRFSIKAFDDVNYLWLTGQKPEVYHRMEANLRYALDKTEQLGVACALIDDLIDESQEEVSEALEAFLERLDERGAVIDFEELKKYHKKTRPIDETMIEIRRRAWEEEDLPFEDEEGEPIWEP